MIPFDARGYQISSFFSFSLIDKNLLYYLCSRYSYQHPQLDPWHDLIFGNILLVSILQVALYQMNQSLTMLCRRRHYIKDRMKIISKSADATAHIQHE